MTTESDVVITTDENEPSTLKMKFEDDWYVGAFLDGRVNIAHIGTCSIGFMPRNKAIAFYKKLLPLMIEESKSKNMSPKEMPPTVEEVELALDECIAELEAAK